MSANTKDGGQAFPSPGVALNGHQRGACEGMSLRDYFAAQALSGIEASQGNSGNFVSTVEKVVDRAYELADAMLKARLA
jgi:ribonuclease I